MPSVREREHLQKLLALKKFGADPSAGDRWTDHDGSIDCLAYLFELYEKENVGNVNYENPTPGELETMLAGMETIRSGMAGKEAQAA